MTPEGISRVDAERTAAQEGLKQSSLSDAKVYLGAPPRRSRTWPTAKSTI
ncbi:conserved transmembrane transport domain protein [Mycobacterium kansasii]|uniref:Conserved transmembrane transport domain protein n=1 Tax=Mycobacterium kansasii TaxID=1768 RepID=A0A1V3XMQ0_MYCKA|nr:conserved transmembrane transport domain protein [Mycobacterium kansasii]